MAITCCKGCVPPKRTPTCKFDGTCNKYAEAKEKHDREKAEQDRRKTIDAEIYNGRCTKVLKAMKERNRIRGQM